MVNFLRNIIRPSSFSQNSLHPHVLVIYDGWGLAPPSEGNAISRARTPNMDYYFTQYAHGELIASGESVGLPANEVGNSEVGHLTIGVGRVIYQSLKRINNAIEDNSFYGNTAFLSAIAHARKYNSKLHLMGLVSSGHVHSSVSHLYSLLKLCKIQGFPRVYLHLFTDGRDAPPKEGASIIMEIQKHCSELMVGEIASVTGRYYAMDRDARWSRTQRVYDALTMGKGVLAANPVDAVKNAYAQQQTDEFVEPTVIVREDHQFHGAIQNNDAVIFFNFRVDRPRQLTMAFTTPDFETMKTIDFGFDMYRDETKRTDNQSHIVAGTTFQRQKWPQNLYFVTMTEYQKKIPVNAIAFPPFEMIRDSLPEIVSKYGQKQYHIAESEKERMMTYYIDGMRSDRFTGEEIKIVASPRVATYDKRPEMSAEAIVKEFVSALRKNLYQFFVINFANPDMVAHTGSIPASIKAIETVDKQAAIIVEETLAVGGTVYITADHGNAEELITYPTTSFFYTTSKGTVNTDHSNNPVPFIVISESLRNKNITLPQGTLSDVAPTVLGMMKLEKPPLMTGRDLLSAHE
ncbi:phosphoglycerate mutase (2,3-diphosphoglycerate-independent) [Candidatus Woesebacteria bacterium RIFCSPHIGHO2_01_FULL_41_10]|uniref:2,3-bisphosphoglycerate-independent phosphoglycerate mutase n=1 Tax=Candidatus Woesebacteria bacterium RIFCSPHIGHO2_01_FULL_41_10 TaxID=1802500 RepID=A0A1F7YLC3_9BACT|nr:MAG: phosphoglycerate mutase (2,3-diphosphoglycerate-independent) [Candidatus Woesebacteria bacterium RIFCSPHIGHO2_01_FULL_41_10]